MKIINFMFLKSKSASADLMRFLSPSLQWHIQIKVNNKPLTPSAIKKELDKVPYQELPGVNFTFTIIALGGASLEMKGIPVPNPKESTETAENQSSLAQYFAPNAKFNDIILPSNVDLVILEPAGIDFLVTEQNAALFRKGELQRITVNEMVF